MSDTGFTQLKAPLSKYEISDSGTMVRSIKNKSIVGLEKGSIRLTDDSGNRLTVNKKDFATKLIPITSDAVPVFEEVKPSADDDSSGNDNQPLEEQKETKQEVTPKKEEMSKTKAKKTAKVKAPKAKKVKAVKEKKVKAPKQPKATKEDALTAEQKAEVKAIVKGEGSKASKMKSIYKVTKSIQATADALDTHYSYVYNKLIWYPANPPKKK